MGAGPDGEADSEGGCSYDARTTQSNGFPFRIMDSL